MAVTLKAGSSIVEKVNNKVSAFDPLRRQPVYLQVSTDMLEI